jgi:hypothetical protein
MNKVRVALLMSFILLVSCSTASQRQEAFINENMTATYQKSEACIQRANTNPAYQSIAEHMPLNSKATLEQLADNGKPTDKDIKVIIALHNEKEPCRVQLIQDEMKILPGLVPIDIKYFHEKDLIAVDLIQRKITWGEANKKYMASKVEYQAKFRAFVDQLYRDLNASHRAELAQRQAAYNALSQWSYQQQVLRQNQELIDAQRNNNMMHCTMVPDGNGNVTGNCQ